MVPTGGRRIGFEADTKQNSYLKGGWAWAMESYRMRESYRDSYYSECKEAGLSRMEGLSEEVGVSPIFTLSVGKLGFLL